MKVPQEKSGEKLWPNSIQWRRCSSFWVWQNKTMSFLTLFSFAARGSSWCLYMQRSESWKWRISARSCSASQASSSTCSYVKASSSNTRSCSNQTLSERSFIAGVLKRLFRRQAQTAVFVSNQERKAAMDHSHVSIGSTRRHWASQRECGSVNCVVLSFF